MRKLKLLDLFCGAGGLSWGYMLAGFRVMGVDMKRQSRYPFEFVQDDALGFLKAHAHRFDVIHASPPCQAYSNLNNLHKRDYPDLIDETRCLLRKSNKPYIIENGVNAPLLKPLYLRGDMFAGLLTYRPRLFETSFEIAALEIPDERERVPDAGNGCSESGFIHVVGSGSAGDGLRLSYKRLAMGIQWMSSRELSQAVPPAYSQYVGASYLESIGYDACFPELLVKRELRQLRLF